MPVLTLLDPTALTLEPPLVIGFRSFGFSLCMCVCLIYFFIIYVLSRTNKLYVDTELFLIVPLNA